jgi:hypothetical protein
VCGEACIESVGAHAVSSPEVLLLISVGMTLSELCSMYLSIRTIKAVKDLMDEVNEAIKDQEWAPQPPVRSLDGGETKGGST